MSRILVIEDDDAVRAMLKNTLEREGYDVKVATNGGEGQSIFRQYPAELIITDILMPEKEGIETIMELRRDFPDVKIMAISGGGMIASEEYLKIAKSAGALRTLPKPFRRDDLLKNIRELLEEP